MKTESGTGRTVPIHSRIYPLILKRYEDAMRTGSKYLLNFKDGEQTKMLTYARYFHIFTALRDELHLDPNHRPHDGRKHFVTAAKKHGVDEYAIKYIVGHKISDITESVYTKREPGWLKAEIQKIK